MKGSVVGLCSRGCVFGGGGCRGGIRQTGPTNLFAKVSFTLARTQTLCFSTSRNYVSSRPKTALVFPGQGVQKVGMLASFTKAFPNTVRPLLQEIDDKLALDQPLSKVISQGPAALLTACENSQPAIFTTSMVIHHVLKKDFGFDIDSQTDLIMGHSLGEFAALAAAGCLSTTNAAYLVHRRAVVMAECSRREERGAPPPDPMATSFNHPLDPVSAARSTLGMVALLSQPDHQPPMLAEIEKILALPGSDSPIPEGNLVQIGNLNSSSQIVLSGHISGIFALLAHLREFAGHDPHTVRLNITSPFHTTIMKPAEEVVRAMLEKAGMITFPGSKSVVSNVSSKEFESAEDVTDLLARQATEVVDWVGSIQYAKEKKGVRRFIALGPGRVAAKLISSEGDKRIQVLHVAEPHDCEYLMKELTKDV